jgi:hypothetical protein
MRVLLADPFYVMLKSLAIAAERVTSDDVPSDGVHPLN